MEPAAHVLLLLDVGPGSGAELQRAADSGRAAVPAHLLAGHLGPLPHQVFVADCHGKKLSVSVSCYSILYWIDL